MSAKISLGLKLFVLSIFLLLLNSSLATLAPNAYFSGSAPYQTPYFSIDDASLNFHLITVKFRESAIVRLRNHVLTSLAGENLISIRTLLNNSQVTEVRRLFTRSEMIIDQERQALQAISNEQLADLNSYYLITLKPETSLADAKELIDQLNQQPNVETAYAEPIYHLAGGTDIPAATPLMTELQEQYLGAAPLGINARHAWSQPGGRGSGVRFIDIEGGWQLDHEDLNFALLNGVSSTQNEQIAHGTAVMGIVAAIDNSYGVTGIAPDVEARAIAVDQSLPKDSTVLADAIDIAIANSVPGDIFLVELQAAGPGSNPVEGDPCLGQHGYIPPEFWEASFDAIKNATNLGRVVIEAAGNGTMDLDDPRYTISYQNKTGNAFSRAFRDSGAIFVGASYLLAPTCFTNFGSRVDLQGQGEAVVTTGIGDLFDGSGVLTSSDPRQYYTDKFGGTSAAAPIVVGAAADLQGMAKARGTTLTPAQILQILRETGTSQPSGTLTKQIGPMPNLLRAMYQLPAPVSCDPNAPIIRASLASDGTEANLGDYLSLSDISSDGHFIVFSSDATNLVANDTNAAIDVFVYDRLSCLTTRVSIASNGLQGNSYSSLSSISADGRFVAFRSYASNLVPNDTNSYDDIFVHDRQTGQTTRVSVASDGTQGNLYSSAPSISADGRFVSFDSQASNLAPGDNECIFGYHCSDIFVHDRQTSQTNRISVTFDGLLPTGESYNSLISDDGRFVVFESDADNLVPGDTNYDCYGRNCLDIFEYDRQTGQTTRVSVASDGSQGNGHSYTSSISGNGRFTAFSSFANNLVPDDTNNVIDGFVHDRQTGQTTRISVASDGTQGNNNSGAYSISADGRFVAFDSMADNLVPESVDCVFVYHCNNIFVHDRQTGQTIRVTVSFDGSQANNSIGPAVMSDDGRFVTFYSSANNLVPNDSNGIGDIFVARVLFPPTSPPGAPPMRNSYNTHTPSLSWSRISWAIRYEVQLSDNSDFNNATTYPLGNDLAFTVPTPLTNDRYYWRVRACSTATNCGAWSTKESFVVDAP